MNMIQRTYTCRVPDSKHPGYEYKVSAWQAMGSNRVNIRLWDPIFGWSQDYPEHGLKAVETEKLSDYAKRGIRTMDELIGYLFYVKA